MRRQQQTPDSLSSRLPKMMVVVFYFLVLLQVMSSIRMLQPVDCFSPAPLIGSTNSRIALPTAASSPCDHKRITPLFPAAFTTKATSPLSLVLLSSSLRTSSCLAASRSSSSSSSANKEIVVVQAEKLFQQHCDSNDLMTFNTLQELKFVAELMEEGDLLEEELEELWNNASKSFKNDNDEERIGMDAFVQIYREIDDLFEDEDDNGNDGEIGGPSMTTTPAVEKDESNVNDDLVVEDEDASSKEELVAIFKSIATNDGTLLSREALMKWDEAQNLMNDGLLDDGEFESIWQKTPKAPESKDQININGFLKFNHALDELFDFDEDDGEGYDEDETAVIAEAASAESESTMIDDVDLSPAELFKALADSNGLVGMNELKRWGELQEMIAEGDLMPLELENFFDQIKKDPKHPNMLDREGFMALCNKIDSLFEEVGEDDGGDEMNADNEGKPAASAPAPTSSSSTKTELLAALDRLNQDKDRLPCGLESTEKEQRYTKELVSALESEGTNVVRQRQGSIEMTDLAGEWELLYTSSSAMAYNKGLSGLGGSFPNGSFGGLKMKLTASKYMTDVEYTERINVVPDSASFDVKINGDWELRSSVSIFTGQPSIVLTVVPERVTYGPTSTRADHWKSLGPTNMLDITYLDDDLRVMRGNTATDSILIFKII